MIRLLLSYSFRSLFVRRTSAFMTALGIALTVAVFAGVFALRSGVEAIYEPKGSEDLAVYIRQGSKSEGESGITRPQVNELIKGRSEIVQVDDQPLAAAEVFLAIFMPKIGGGKTNVPLRGVDRMSMKLNPTFEIVEGRALEFGTLEVVVGRPLANRIENCQVNDKLILNTTEFTVVGIFEVEGAQRGEIWSDAHLMMEAMDRPVFQRVIARVHEGTDFDKVNAELKADPRLLLSVTSEREYLANQTTFLGDVLLFLAYFLTAIMGTAAVLGAMNTMLAAVSARTHEIGVLLAIGYSRVTIFFAFLIESALLGACGAILGCLLVLPVNGVETGAMNFNTFTDISFRFHLSVGGFLASSGIAVFLGVLGGMIPAFLASMKHPIEALRRR